VPGVGDGRLVLVELRRGLGIASSPARAISVRHRPRAGWAPWVYYRFIR